MMSLRLILNRLHTITLRSTTNFSLNSRSYYTEIQKNHAQFSNNKNKEGNRLSRIQNVEKENKLFMKSDPDTFGTISSLRISETEFDDSGDIEEEEYTKNLPNKSHKLDLKEYAKLIKDHLKHHRLKEAVDVLEIRMLKDHVKSGSYIYHLLISGCAKAGYTKKAFQLYNKMKQCNLKVKPSVYTSLFNACANSPFRSDALQKANRLRELMLEKGYNPNAKNYNAMIKAYGRCGDIKTAYQLVDEMLENDIPVNTETFNFLLQACASDTDYGFRHALLTWHKMLKTNCSPNIYTFNIMLRCVRDCSIGDLETMEEVLKQILFSNVKQIEANERSEALIQLPESQTDNNNLIKSVNNAQTKNEAKDTEIGFTLHNNQLKHQTVDETPNLISNTPHLGSLISINEVKNPEDRLLLLGGFSGFLNEMKNAKITPGIETFTLLLDVIPSTIAAEKKLISMVRKIGLKADIDFFNILIKKRSMRYDYDGARDVLNMIKTAKLHPDIITYGVLALSCQKREDARHLLNDMLEKGVRMNIQILGAMLRQGCAQKNFNYINEILQITLDERIKPNEEFLKHLDRFYESNLRMIKQKHPITKKASFTNNFDNLKQKLDIWYEEWNIQDLKFEDAVKKIKEHPYKRFKEEEIKGLENDKNEKLLEKQKLRKYIKRIKIKDDVDEQLQQQKEELNEKMNVKESL